VAPSTRQSIFPSRRRCVICVIRRPQPVRFWWANGRHSSGVVNARARVFLLLFSGESSLVRISALGQHQHLRGAVEGSSTPGRRLGHPQDDPCRACFQQARNRLPPRRQSHPTDRRSARRLTSASRLLNSFCLRFSGLESRSGVCEDASSAAPPRHHARTKSRGPYRCRARMISALTMWAST
jgi:hypothetical protein